MGDPIEDLGSLWRWFAGHFEQGEAPAYAAICRAVADDREILELHHAAPPQAHLPLVLLAAVHYLLLGGLDHPLGPVYQGGLPAEEAPALFRDCCLAQRESLLEIMQTRRVQTNEVGRSAYVGLALSWAASRLPGPFRLLDVGSSAGLNLLCDRYLLDYGDHGTTGDADAEVRIDCQVVAGNPPVASRLPDIDSRIGVDLDPPDLRDPDDARWLLACVWPETGRLARTERAIALARHDPPRVLEGNALELLPRLLDEPVDGTDIVLTTWAYAYLSIEERARFVAILRDAAGRRPRLWIACDGQGVVDLVDPAAPPAGAGSTADVMSAVTFGGDGIRPELLAFVHPHGRWVDWRA